MKGRGLLARPVPIVVAGGRERSFYALLFYRRLGRVAAVVVNGIRAIVLHDSPSSVHAP